MTARSDLAVAFSATLFLVACGSAETRGAGSADAVRPLPDAALSALAWPLPAARTACPAPSPNLLRNGGFEQALDGWAGLAWQPGAVFAPDGTRAFAGSGSALVASAAANDARLLQAVSVEPGVPHRLSGWLQARDVAAEPGAGEVGANLGLDGTWLHSEALLGTTSWTYRSLVFNPGSAGEVTVAARLGHWGAAASGSAWFDEVRLERVQRREHPLWSFLVLVYGGTDLTWVDGTGTTRRVVAQMTEDERRTVATLSRRFVEEDLGRLSSGAVTGRVEVRFPDQPLGRLSRFGDGWWPSPADTAPDREAHFDSVIVVWDPRGHDVATGAPVWLGSAGGLTPYTGTGQTYSAIVADMFVVWGAGRNTLKHEFGHSLLWYFDAMGLTPQPAVTNHASPGDYVHCLTGAPYAWVDETDANPIPNSIYNDDAGFTHDYYSGTTALASEPARCLGVGPEAWAYGGPATVQRLTWSLDPGARLLRLEAQVQRLVDAGALTRWRGALLSLELRLSEAALRAGRTTAAIRLTQVFAGLARRFAEHGFLAPATGGALAEEALDVVAQLCD
jgi:hypothetical protein